MSKGLQIIGLILLLTSCIDEVYIDEMFVEDSYVVTGIISPQNHPEIRIDTTMSLFWYDSANVIKPYSFKLYEDDGLIFSLDGNDPVIKIPIFPKEEAFYNFLLEVGDVSVSANTSIPDKVIIQRADVRYTEITTLDYDRISEVIIELTDPVEDQNFYEIQLIDSKGRPRPFYGFQNISDPILLQEATLYYEPASFVFSDASFSGDQVKMKLLIGGFPEEIWLVLRSLSPEYYHYIKSWHKHIYQQNTGIEIDDKLEDINYISLLLSGDPVPLFSNVNNGIGIFAGYSEDIKKFQLIK